MFYKFSFCILFKLVCCKTTIAHQLCWYLKFLLSFYFFSKRANNSILLFKNQDRVFVKVKAVINSYSRQEIQLSKLGLPCNKLVYMYLKAVYLRSWTIHLKRQLLTYWMQTTVFQLRSSIRVQVQCRNLSPACWF